MEEIEENVKDDEFKLSADEVASITKAGPKHLMFKSKTDPEKFNESEIYTAIIKKKIQSKFGIEATVGNGLKYTGKSVIIFMKCAHKVKINVSTPLDQFKSGSSIIFKISQEKCTGRGCGSSKKF